MRGPDTDGAGTLRSSAFTVILSSSGIVGRSFEPPGRERSDMFEVVEVLLANDRGTEIDSRMLNRV